MIISKRNFYDQYSDEKITSIVNEIIPLLKNNDEAHWAKLLENILCKFKNSDNKAEAAELFIKIMRGGMGSFLDLVLHRDGKWLIKENNQLDKLKMDLYDEAKKIILNSRDNK